MKKRCIATISLTALLSISTIAYGEGLGELKEKHNELNFKKSAIEKQLGSNNSMLERTTEELKSIEANMKSINSELLESEKTLNDLNKEIIGIIDMIDSNEKDLSNKQEMLKNRLNTMYKNSTSSYVEVILSSEDMLDLFNRLSMVKNIFTYDSEIIEEVKSKKTELIQSKEELKAKEDKAKAIASSLSTKKAELDNLKASKENITESLKEKQQQYKAEIDDLNMQSNRAMTEMRDIEKAEQRKAEEKRLEDIRAEEQKAAEYAAKDPKAAVETVKEEIQEKSQNKVVPKKENSTAESEVKKETVVKKEAIVKKEEAPVKEKSYPAESEKSKETAKPGLGKAMIMKATAYDPSPASNGGSGITAMGTKPRPGVIAVDPKVIPLGTRVYIEYMDGTPLGYCTAEDTGGAIKGNKIDILFNTRSEALQFGVRNMKLYIVN